MHMAQEPAARVQAGEPIRFLDPGSLSVYFVPRYSGLFMTTSTQQEGPSQATQPPSQGISVPPSPGEEGVLAQAWSNNYILTPFYTGK